MFRIGLAGVFLFAMTAGAIAQGPAGAARHDTAPTRDFTRAEPDEHLQGGTATALRPFNANAFSQSSSNMSFEKELDFKVGNGIFRKLWVSAPSSTTSSDGLGPLFNARSCQRCHLKDGRGHPPAANFPDDDATSLLVRLSVPPRTDEQRRLMDEGRIPFIPEPTYGKQLQDVAVQGLPAEGHPHFTWEEIPVELADGAVVSLRRPTLTISEPGFGPLDPEVMLSARIAPPMIGLGLLEAIDAADIEALADPDDADGDGISGKAQRVWSREHDRIVLGRFGWKGGDPSLIEQAADAFSNDIGIASRYAPDPWGDCTGAQALCREAPHGNVGTASAFEIDDDLMQLVLFYTRNLAVPARRNVDDPTVLAGKQAFYEAGCIACHVPKHVTAADAPGAEQRGQLIWPYTDMLLHDMGEGLADNRPEWRATGREWRTPPLWGIGLTKTVSDHTFFLHDGRARSLLEAILWHGGEARAARDRVVAMSAEDRDALLAFLDSL